MITTEAQLVKAVDLSDTGVVLLTDRFGEECEAYFTEGWYNGWEMDAPYYHVRWLNPDGEVDDDVSADFALEEFGPFEEREVTE